MESTPLRSALAVAVVFATQALLLGWYYPKWSYTPGRLTTYDVAGYYMYLPAAFVYDDLAGDSYHDEVTALTRPGSYWDHSFEHEASGRQVMKYPLGQALQFAPFFAVAHAYASYSGTYDADGFSRPYQVALAIEILVVALIGLLLLRWLLLKFFPDGAAAWAILGVGLGTNYLEYSSLTGAMTHNNLFTLYAAVALASDSFHRRPRLVASASIGVLVGLATLTRPTELLTCLLPLLWGVRASWAGIRERLAYLGAQWRHLLVAAVVGASVIALQPIYWYSVTGDWVVYSYQDQGFDWLRPHLWKGFASWRAGWIPYTPMGILMLVGMAALWRRRSTPAGSLAPALTLYLLLFCYVAWSWSIWWYGGSFGQRTLVQVYPLLALGLAAAIEASQRSRWPWRVAFAVAFGACTYVNLYWTHQAHHGGQLVAQQMTGPYYLATFGRFRRDPMRLKLLDRSRLYEGPLHDSILVGQLGYEDLPDSLTCAPPPIAGAKSLCLREGTGFGPRSAFALPQNAKDDRWLRASATVDVRARTHDWWAMSQFIVGFYRTVEGGAPEQVDALMIRPERIAHGGKTRVYLDGPIPDEDVDSVFVSWWKPGLGGELLVDEVELVSYRPE